MLKESKIIIYEFSQFELIQHGHLTSIKQCVSTQYDLLNFCGINENGLKMGQLNQP